MKVDAPAASSANGEIPVRDARHADVLRGEIVPETDGGILPNEHLFEIVKDDHAAKRRQL